MHSSQLWDEAAAIISGLIGGGRYGLKIRVPHAVVMTFLFANSMSFKEKLKVIVKLAAEHATNLAAFAFSYKAVLAALKVSSKMLNGNQGVINSSSLKHLVRVLLEFLVDGPQFIRKHSTSQNATNSPGIPEQPYHSFLAGAIGGYFVWGRYSGVNYQLLLYLASRIIVASVKLAGEKGIRPFSLERFKFPLAYPWAAAGIWGTVMMLFEEYPDMLHPSLKRSMDEIYRFHLI